MGRSIFPFVSMSFPVDMLGTESPFLKETACFISEKENHGIEEYLITSSLPVFFEKDNPVLFFTLVISFLLCFSYLSIFLFKF